MQAIWIRPLRSQHKQIDSSGVHDKVQQAPTNRFVRYLRACGTIHVGQYYLGTCVCRLLFFSKLSDDSIQSGGTSRSSTTTTSSASGRAPATSRSTTSSWGNYFHWCDRLHGHIYIYGHNNHPKQNGKWRSTITITDYMIVLKRVSCSSRPPVTPGNPPGDSWRATWSS